MASSPQSEKEMFFARFDHLDELASNEKEEDEITVGCTPGHKHFQSPATLTCKPRLGQSDAAGSERGLNSAAANIGLASLASSSQETMQPQNQSLKSESNNALPRLSKKRGGRKSLQLQPEDAQVFRGLTFYFVPNNNIAPARKKRIEKAQEYGGTWVKEWSSSVTHVIVDAGLKFSDVTKAVDLDKLRPSYIIVNETYLPDCIKFRVLLPTQLIRFQIACNLSPFQAEQYHSLANAGGLVSEALETAVSSDILRTAEHCQGPEDPAAISGEAISSSAAEEIKSKIIPTGPKDKTSDELDIAVAEVQEVAHLPFDSEDESFEPPSHGSPSDSEECQPKRPYGKRRGKRPSRSPPNSVDAQRYFSCMRKNDGISKNSNPNHRTIEKLDQMAHYYHRTGDHWRTIAYRKCVTALNGQWEHIKTREQAMRIPGIGERLAVKVEEVALTNSLRRLESTVFDPTDKTRQLFMGIYQVGLPTAARWIAQGHKSLQDLKSKVDLTTNQEIGIDHYDDFLARIPRNEVTVHGEIVRRACTEADARIEVIVGGSYRRGAVDSGDIDLIITKENASLENIRTILTNTVIPQLFREGFLKAGLATSSSTPLDQGSKWHGASTLPGSQIWRRIDLLFVPRHELGAALIYFTGNDVFNRSIRLLASRKTMRLNQHGLYKDVMRGEKRERITQGQLLEARSEERIFEILGVPWRPPQHRIC